MKIAIVGTGYVGLVSGTCFAELGHDVLCVDSNLDKIQKLENGIIPIYEPGLEEMVKRNLKENRLKFTTDIKIAVEENEVIFIAVGTPPDEDGSADLKYVLNVAESIGKYINDYKVIIDKSTVPVGTVDKVRNTVNKQIDERKVNFDFDVVSNPEFLKEGSAIEDFMRPDRIVIGVDTEKATDIMKELYETFLKNGNAFIVMDTKSAEMTKYVSNSLLATKISFMNEMANICEILGADVEKVRLGVGSDSRIGYQFLYSGVGYGGSCFPKDVQALIRTASEAGYQTKILNAVEEVNYTQKKVLINKVLGHFNNDIKDKTFAIWGLSFKPKTDDMREAPSVVIINELLERGVKIKAYDPEAMNEAQKIFGDKIEYVADCYKVLENADALFLITEWGAFRNPNFSKIKKTLKSPVIFDGRNQYNKNEMLKNGFHYYSIGR